MEGDLDWELAFPGPSPATQLLCFLGKVTFPP